jgi:hypothetical protein
MATSDSSCTPTPMAAATTSGSWPAAWVSTSGWRHRMADAGYTHATQARFARATICGQWDRLFSEVLAQRA